MKALTVLLLTTYITLANGKNCIKAGGKNTCTKEMNDCADGLVCMEIQRGNSGNTKLLCGEPQAEGCWCDPSLVSQEACQPGLVCEDDNGQYKCIKDETERSHCSSTEGSWRLIYHHDGNGNPMEGNHDDLINEITNGAEAKVWTSSFGLVNIQKVSVSYNGDMEMKCVHGQSLFWADEARMTYFSLLHIFSSCGNHHVTQFFINNPLNQVRINSNAPLEMKWYIRPLPGSTSFVSQGSRLDRLIRDGAHIRVSYNNTFRPLEVVEIRDGIKGVSIHEMRDIKLGEEFNTTEQRCLKDWSVDEVKLASWRYNDHTLTETKVVHVTTEWLVDPCWRFVYRHSSAGTRLSGSKESLIAAVEAGKRIRLKVGNKFYEANVIRQPVGEEEVIAQVFDSIGFNITEGIWEWLNVKTNGEVQTIQFGIGGSDLLSDAPLKRMEVTWYSEDRIWDQQVSTADIDDLVFAGADVRYSILMDGEIKWFQADYAQKNLIIPRNPPLVLPKNRLYSEREIVYNGTHYIQRLGFANWETNAYTYADYLVGSTEKIDYSGAPSVQVLSFFTSKAIALNV